MGKITQNAKRYSSSVWYFLSTLLKDLAAAETLILFRERCFFLGGLSFNVIKILRYIFFLYMIDFPVSQWLSICHWDTSLCKHCWSLPSLDLIHLWTNTVVHCLFFFFTQSDWAHQCFFVIWINWILENEYCVFICRCYIRHVLYMSHVQLFFRFEWGDPRHSRP